MKTLFSPGALGAALLLVAAQPGSAQIPVLGVPLKPDPPPAIDGRLDEWNQVPNIQAVNQKAQVGFGAGAWKSATDLSADVRLAWRHENLYLAVNVIDDKIVQNHRDRQMFLGDHIELYLDVAPALDTDRTSFGTGQIHFGFSPGNFSSTGDPLFDRAPEAVIFSPQGTPVTGILVAAQKTAQGYSLEAAIPWALIQQAAGLGALAPNTGMELGVEVGISDSDNAASGQEKMMTLLSTPWEFAHRPRLQTATLSGTDGVALPIVRELPIFDGVTLKSGEKRELSFEVPATPAGKQAIIAFKARIDFNQPAGYNAIMRLTLNGQRLGKDQSVNKKSIEERVSGAQQPMTGDDSFTLPYAPDFESTNSHPEYGLKEAKAANFELGVANLLKPGKNTLLIENIAGAETAFPIITSNGGLLFRTPQPVQQKRPAPTGPLPFIHPVAQHKTAFTVGSGTDNEPLIKINDRSFQVESRFSTPDGNWQKSNNRFFTHQRQIEKKDEAILIRDTFTNLTNENLPLMQRYRVVADEDLKKVWLAGLSPASLEGASNNPANPTTYGITEGAGIGVMAYDDISQVHVSNFSGRNFVGLADNQLVLKPNVTHVTEWIILPTAQPNYWSFVNAARRFRDVNFKIDGTFAFFFPGENRRSAAWSDQQVKDFFGFKGTHFASPSYTDQYKSLHPHGTAYFKVDWTQYKQQIARFKKLLPTETKFISYFHSFLDSADDAVEANPDARQLRSDGTQADYGDPVYKIFVPTETNDFGRLSTRFVDNIMAPQPQGLGCDGIYWDEVEYSSAQYHYDDFDKPVSGLPWDGVSADIDPQTKKISRLKSSVTLISQPLRLSLVRRILERGSLYANGAPHTRSMMRQHFPRFVETGSISNCTQAHLFTPVALGDHLTERNALDAYRWMVRALDYGCLYAWYGDDIIPTAPTLASYMYPFTPLELHEGYVIGKERIVTNRSGSFGWGDNSQHEVHVFDDQGREVKDFKALTVKKNGQTFTELRLAQDWSAAIVRK